MSTRDGFEPAAGALLFAAALVVAILRRSALYSATRREPAPPWALRELAAAALAVVPWIGLFSHVAGRALPGGYAAGYVLTSLAWALAAAVARLEAGRVQRLPSAALPAFHLLALLFLLVRFFAQIFEAATGTDLPGAGGDWAAAALSAVPTAWLAADSVARRATFARRMRAYGSLEGDTELGEAGASGKGTPAPPPLDFEQRLYLVWKNAREKTFPRIKSNLARVAEMLPFVWPKRKPALQARVFAAAAIVAAVRVINIYVPVTYKNAVNALSSPRAHVFPWQTILVYGCLYYSKSFLQDVRGVIWLKVSQNTTAAISVRILAHLHDLPLAYHLTRKTGEVLRTMDRGTSSVSSLLNLVVFNICPTLLDVGLACGYFLIYMHWMFSVVMFVTIAAFFAWTIGVTEWRTKFRREMIESDNATNQAAVDSLMNFETVKFFGNEGHEVSRYERAIGKYQRAETTSNTTLAVLNWGQNGIVAGGLLAGMLVAGWQVSRGRLTVGDFVLVVTYIVQIATPLNWLGTSYRMISQSFIDMEKMLELLRIVPAVQDPPDGRALEIRRGEVEFQDVQFSYDGGKTQALRGVSFRVPAGNTVALVGQSGSGKSTVARLLFRFYDVQGGRVLVDGQDVRSVTQRSLRQAIGVVPQDTCLFNETVRYNIEYGRVGASEEEIVAAARAACIHDKIMEFPQKYDTKVGERGLRLSGGEKQRVAIARTLLKDPRVCILDEATSALDTGTEQAIQQSINALCAGHSRTMLVIAHRLSTIVGADEILVVSDGRIAERGTHAQLLAARGAYAAMWAQQAESAGGAGAGPSTGGEAEGGGRGPPAPSPAPPALPIAPSSSSSSAPGRPLSPRPGPPPAVPPRPPSPPPRPPSPPPAAAGGQPPPAPSSPRGEAASRPISPARNPFLARSFG